MRALWIGIVCVALVACQTNTEISVPRPDFAPIEGEIGPLAPFVSQAVVSERRAQINDCLVAQGLPPLPEGLGSGTAPLEDEAASTFRRCMARSS